MQAVCPDFKRLYGADVSRAMLDEARRTIPTLHIIHNSAEDLRSIKAQSIDLYLSLRTYQSSLFDLDAAVREAYRVLVPGGAFVVSIANGYVSQDGDAFEVVRGLLVSGSEYVDRTKPR